MNDRDRYFAQLRREMVDSQLIDRGIQDTAVLRAMEEIPRHLFVPEDLQNQAYDDTPLPLGPDQTISQPLIVAQMIELLQVGSSDHILEVGTGSGYEAAVLARVCHTVYTIEIDSLLQKWAVLVLGRLGIRNVRSRLGDGYPGWPEEAPFDGVIVSAACPALPSELIGQLKTGGRCVYPHGKENQILTLVEKTAQGMRRSEHGRVRFVMMKDPQ